MHCKACDAPIPVSWRSVEELDHPILEDLCWHCLNTLRSSLVFPDDNSIEENLELLGIHIKKDTVVSIAHTLAEDD